MKRITSAALVALETIGPFAAPLAHAQGDSFEFKGIALGSDAAQIEADRRFQCFNSPTPLADRACGLRRKGNETIAGVPVENLMLFFYDNKLHMITVGFASKDFDKVTEALKEKYGKAVPETEEVHNRMGAAFSNEKYTWAKSGEVLKAEKYASNIDTSRVTFQTDAGMDEFVRRNELRKKANAKDL